MNQNPNTAQKPPRQGSGFHFYYRVAMRTAFQPLADFQKPGRQRRGERYSLTPGRPRSIAHRLPPLHAERNTPAPSPIQHKSRPGKGAAFTFIIGWRCVPPSSRWLPFRSPDGSGGKQYSRTPGRPRSIAHRLPPPGSRRKRTSLQLQYSTKAALGKGAAFIFIIGWRCVPPSSRWLSSGSPGGSGRGNGIPVRPGRPDSQRTARR